LKYLPNRHFKNIRTFNPGNIRDFFMLSKNQIKHFKSLHLQKYRTQKGLFLAEGIKMVDDLCRAGYPIEEIVVTEAHYPHLPTDTSIKITLVTEPELATISTLKTPNQVIAVCQIRYPDLLKNPSLFDDLVLYLDTIRDPGNLGTILRTASWFGVKNIFCTPDTVELFNPKTVQATMGALASCNLQYISFDDFQARIPLTIPIYGLFLKGDKIYNCSPKSNGILIIGSEAHGIRKSIESKVTHKLTIPPFYPQLPHPESLNASIATAIVLYHFRIPTSS